jgi:ribosome-associated protein
MAAARLGEWWSDTSDVIHFSPRAAEIYGLGSRLVVPRDEISDIIHPDDRAPTLKLVQDAVDHHSDFDVQYRVQRPCDGRLVWIHGRGKAYYDDEGASVGLAGVVADVTPRKTADEAEKLRAQEMEHRAKNVFMLIQALVRLTPFHDHKQFVADLTDRIEAIERAHAVALRSSEEGVLVADLLRRELAPYRAPGRALLRGGAARLTSTAAQSLSMVLHELATNAAKYGALSGADGGRLTVAWSPTDSGGLQIVWTEQTEGGCKGKANPGRDSGFGSMLLKRLIGELGGSFTRRWDEAGMTATIVLGAAHVVRVGRRRGRDPGKRSPEETGARLGPASPIWHVRARRVQPGDRPAEAPMIPVTDTLAIDEAEIVERFVLASGPGGQRVNKVSTAVELRFDVRRSPSLPEPVRDRLERLSGRRLTQDGVLVLSAQRFRTQERNRQDALERLVELIALAAAPPPPPRKKTRPTYASKLKRLDSKARRGAVKSGRGRVSLD